MARGDLDVGALRIVEAVARHGSLTAAAGELRLTQPAVSWQIRRIEERLGVPLFRRLHRGTVPTEEGEILTRAVVAALELIDGATRQIRQRSRRPIVRLHTDYGFAAFWLMPRVAAFRRLHPDVDIHIVASQALDPAGEDAADLTVVFGASGDFPAEARLLMPERVVPVCSPGLAARLGPFGDAATLAAAPLLHLESSPGPRWFIWETWLAAQGCRRREGAGDLHLNTYALVIQAALAEQGVALGWMGLVDSMLDAGVLVPVGPELSRADAGYWLIAAPNPTPTVRAVLEWLTAEFAVSAPE